MSQKHLDTGDRIQAFADGEVRTVTIEMMTADRRIAQCSYTVGSMKRYGMCSLGFAGAIARSFAPRAAMAQAA
jgi:hypothetical protein